MELLNEECQASRSILEAYFFSRPNPTSIEKDALVQKTGMSRRQVDVWVCTHPSTLE
jgi:hypothetical protein